MYSYKSTLLLITPNSSRYFASPFIELVRKLFKNCVFFRFFAFEYILRLFFLFVARALLSSPCKLYEINVESVFFFYFALLFLSRVMHTQSKLRLSPRLFRLSFANGNFQRQRYQSTTTPNDQQWTTESKQYLKLWEFLLTLRPNFVKQKRIFNEIKKIMKNKSVRFQRIHKISALLVRLSLLVGRDNFCFLIGYDRSLICSIRSLCVNFI